MEAERSFSRRGFFLGAAGTVAAASGTAGLAAAASPPSFGGWFSNTSNYDGVVDKTGQDTVTVTVGVKANGGNYGFGPPAIRVDPGTKVTWTWNGKDAPHSVTFESGSVDSGLQSASGHTFSHTFDTKGVYKYYCQPHEALGMKGVVVVGDVSLASAGSSSSAASNGGSSGSGSGGAGGSSGKDVTYPPVPFRFEAIGVVALGFISLVILGMLALTFTAMRDDRHSPAVVREQRR